MKRKLIVLLITALTMLSGCKDMYPDSGFIDVMPYKPANTQEAKETPHVEPTATPTVDNGKIVMYDSPVEYKSRANTLNVRADSSTESRIISTISYEQVVTVIGEKESFYAIKIDENENGGVGFCHKDYLVDVNTMLYAYPEVIYAQKEELMGHPVYDDDGMPVIVKSELVDVRLYVPDAVYYLLFAHEDNFLHEKVYERDIPLLQKTTAQKLRKAFDKFKADGFTMKVYDAYRPLRVQKRLYDIVQDSRYIGNPYRYASYHNRGAAVDIALIDDSTGQEVHYPSPMHTFDSSSHRNNKHWTEEEKQNVDYMTNIMIDCGFKYIDNEWWHFSDVDGMNYPVTDLDFSKLTMKPAQ